MGLFSMEHSRAVYRADFMSYTALVIALALSLVVWSPSGHPLQTAGYVLTGLAGWTFLEYALHRFVFHGLQPFRRWHAEHHRRPAALICTPTIMSMTLFATLIAAPAFLLLPPWNACALALGGLIGYLVYSVVHHAVHHWRARHAWLRRCKQRHALHHRPIDNPGCYGVSTGFWDEVFRTGHRAGRTETSPRKAC